MLTFSERTVAVGPTTALLTGSTSGAGGESTVAEYWRAGASPQCAAVDPAAGSISVTLTHLQPSSRYHFRLAADAATGTAFGMGPSFATLPAGAIPEGVMIGHASVGRLGRTGALDLLDRSLASPLRFAYAGSYWRLAPAAVGLHTNADALVDEALKAVPGQTLAAPAVSVDTPVLNGYLAGLDKRYGHKSDRGERAAPRNPRGHRRRLGMGSSSRPSSWQL